MVFTLSCTSGGMTLSIDVVRQTSGGSTAPKKARMHL